MKNIVVKVMLVRYECVNDNYKESGLGYFNSRNLDTKVGRFMKADIVTGKKKKTHTLNRCIYPLNNTIKNIDPRGMLQQGKIEYKSDKQIRSVSMAINKLGCFGAFKMKVTVEYSKPGGLVDKGKGNVQDLGFNRNIYYINEIFIFFLLRFCQVNNTTMKANDFSKFSKSLVPNLYFRANKGESNEWDSNQI